MSDYYYMEQSKLNWYAPNKNSLLENNGIEKGCLMRIAKATEAMAENHVRLINERDYLSRRNRDNNAAIERLRRSNAALRGHITRLKKQLAKEGE